MPFNPTDHISVYSKPRPTRIAFLVDVEMCPKTLLNSILDFNLKLWGGRLNPVIPIFKGVVPPGYWNLLRFYDPDIIYSYSKLPDNLALDIDKQISPYYLFVHKIFDKNGPPNFAPQLRNSFLSVDFDSIPMGIPNPSGGKFSFLTCHNYSDWEHYQFFHTNFGLYNDEHRHQSTAELEPYAIPAKAALDIFVSQIAEKRRGLLYPWQFTCSEVPLREYHSGKNIGQECFTVVIGDSIWNWLYMWNKALLLPVWKRTEINQLYLPISLTDSENVLASVRKLISTHIYRIGSHPPTVIFASYDLPEDKIRSISDTLKGNLDAFASIKSLSCDFDELKDCKDGDWYPSSKFPQHDYVSGNTFYLKPPRPSLRGNPQHGKWMVDFKIEYHPQRFSYTNMSYWWKLPRVAALAHCFIGSDATVGRIDAEGLLSVSIEDDKKQDLCLKIPTDEAVIAMLLLQERNVCYTDDVWHGFKLAKPTYGYVRLSDKGRYLNGYLSLVGDLYRAGSLVGHHFWRTIFRMMCGGQNETDFESALKKELLPIISELPPDCSADTHIKEQYYEMKVNSLSHVLLKFSRRLKRPLKSIRFVRLLDLFRSERKNFIEKHKNQSGFNTGNDQCKNDLLRALKQLTSLKILLQGVRPVCPRCGSYTWCSLDNIRFQLPCDGCQLAIIMPPEIEWEYKLNTLVQDAIQDHGTFPVVWVLNQMLEYSRESFIFNSSLELCADYNSEPLAEIDIACISDGKFIIGEIKTKAIGFSQDEIEKLCTIARNVSPAEVLIGAFDPSRDELSEVAAKIREKLKDTGIKVRVECPTDEINDPEYYLSF